MIMVDVQGVDEAREELQEIVEFLRDPQKFTRLGGKLPKSVLLTGPPGTGWMKCLWTSVRRSEVHCLY